MGTNRNNAEKKAQISIRIEAELLKKIEQIAG
jgi:hypothetical protein